MKRRHLIALLPGVLLAACGSEAGDSGDRGTGMTVRDSAGVRIVENLDSAWTEETRWRLAEVPDLRIGSLDGSVPGTDFGRLTDVLLVDGHVVAADDQSRAIRVYDAAGRWLRDLGGQGEGPLEFRFIESVFAVLDTAVVWDANRRRLVFFPIDGGEGRAVSYAPGGDRSGGDLIDAILPDGRAVVGPAPVVAAGPEASELLVERSHRVIRAPGSAGDTIGTLPSYVAYTYGRERAPAPILYSPFGAFEPAASDAVWFGWGARGYELRRIPVGPADDVELIVRRPWTAEPAPERIQTGILRYLDSAFSASSGDLPADVQQQQREYFASLRVLDPLPSYWDFEVATDGHVWVNDSRRAEALTIGSAFGSERVGSTGWSVFTPEGRWLGTLDLREDFRPTMVGVDWILGIRTDDLGVQWIERYRIVKPE